MEKNISSNPGALEMMVDLADQENATREIYHLGGGNPAHIPEIEQVWRNEMEHILNEPGVFEHMVGEYDHPQGNTSFREILAAFLSQQYGVHIAKENILITNGSQSGFFALFNLLSGALYQDFQKQICFPMLPEYIGYTDQGLRENMFIGISPKIEKIGGHSFCYQIDEASLCPLKNIAALCISRPTNPTGFVMSDDNCRMLSDIASKKGIPLIIDAAYGPPFPNINFTNTTFWWDLNSIVCLSLSKVGLPGVRTGIIIAREEIIQQLLRVHATTGLTSGSIGPVLASRVLKNGTIERTIRDSIQPYYKKKLSFVKNCIAQYFRDDIPYYIHTSDGAFFLWIWFEDLPITNIELYSRLKKKGVLIVSGHSFFPGLQRKWKHATECIRISYAQDEKVVGKGIAILAEELDQIFS